MCSCYPRLMAGSILKVRIRANEHAPHLERIHQPAADFSFQTLDGTTKRLSDFIGKTVFVDLWGDLVQFSALQKCLQCKSSTSTTAMSLVLCFLLSHGWILQRRSASMRQQTLYLAVLHNG